MPTLASGDAVVANPGTDGMGSLSQGGFLEMSNVKIIDEMVAIITSQRAYEVTRKRFRRRTRC